MDKRAEQFRRQSREENRGRARIRWRYSGRARKLAMNFLERVLSQGGSLNGAAQALGISGLTLKRWQESSGHLGSLRPVEIVETEERGQAVLLSPRGYRVEGLTQEGLRNLLENLG